MSLQLARAPRPLSVRPATRGAGVLHPALHDGSWMGTGRSNERKLPNGHRKGALDAELSMEANLSASTDRLMPYRRPSACPNCPLFPLARGLFIELFHFVFLLQGDEGML